MKKLLTLFVAMQTLISIAQANTFSSSNSFDSLLFQKINEYRTFNGASTIKWSNGAYKMTQHHTDYQVRILTVTHREDKTIPGIINMIELTDRAKYYLTKPDGACSENVHGGKNMLPLDSVTDFSKFVEKIWHKNLNSISAEEIMALRIVFMWDTSPMHKANLLSASCTQGAVSSQFRNIKKTSNSIWYKGKTAIEFESYSTMNFIE